MAYKSLSTLRKEAYDRIAELEVALGKKFNWVKIKRASGDEIATVLGILERDLVRLERRKEEAEEVKDSLGFTTPQDLERDTLKEAQDEALGGCR